MGSFLSATRLSVVRTMEMCIRDRSRDRPAHLPQQVLLGVPKFIRKIHIILVGILKPEALLPKGVHLRGAVGADLLHRRALIAPAAPVEHLDLELLGGVIIDRFPFPDRPGVEDGRQAFR